MSSGAMPRVDAARFSMVPRPDVPRSAFDVPWLHKTTFDAGRLVPIACEEVLPGDSLRLSFNGFARLSTPLVPLMDNLELCWWWFFVPNRLVWSNWQRFMGEQTSPTDTTNFLVPQAQFVAGELVPGTFGNYLGLTVNGSGNTLSVSALPFRAIHLIWNEWFRDEDLQVKVAVATGDGPDVSGTYATPLSVNKRHDYFTTARPWPQKPVAIGTIAPDATGLSIGGAVGFPGFGGFQGSETTRFGGAGAPVTGIGATGGAATAGPLTTRVSGTRVQSFDNYFLPASIAFQSQTQGLPNDYPDVRVLVNDLRTAVMVQSFMERNARGGTRYTELVRSHFGVVSPDARLQRPELLGMGRSMIQVNPVAQTSASGVAGTTTKLAELSAIGTGRFGGHAFSQSFTEHGHVLGFLAVRSFLTYQQGVDRMWFRRGPFDFYWPTLAHLGEQAILGQEIFCNGDISVNGQNDLEVFGYQERWSEYKFKPSRTTGFFNSTNATPLDMWHLAEKFANRAAARLTSSFVTEAPPVARVLQTATNFGEQFLADMMFDCRWVRPMPMFSIPGMGGHL